MSRSHTLRLSHRHLIRASRRRVLAPLSASLLLALTSPALSAQTGFTGTITFLMHSKSGRDQTMVQAAKGKRLRIDMQNAGAKSEGASIIFDGAAHTMTMLMTEQKMYMVISTDSAKRAVQDMAASQAGRSSNGRGRGQQPNANREPSDFKVTKTGRSETVAGVSCDIYRVTGTHDGKPRESEVCAAQGIGFAPLQMGAGGMMGGRGPQMPDVGAFGDLLTGNRGVLKVTNMDSGKPFVELEATKVDRSAPGDAMFAPPPGYTKFEMPSIPNLRGLPKRPPGN